MRKLLETIANFPSNHRSLLLILYQNLNFFIFISISVVLLFSTFLNTIESASLQTLTLGRGLKLWIFSAAQYELGWFVKQSLTNLEVQFKPCFDM